jgi:hypothetical protein
MDCRASGAEEHDRGRMTTPDLTTLPQRGYLPEEVQHMLGLSCIDRVWKLARAGKLPGALKVGNQWRFNREKFDAFLQGQQAA